MHISPLRVLHFGGRTFKSEPVFNDLFTHSWCRFREKWGITDDDPFKRDFGYLKVLQADFSSDHYFTPLSDPDF